MAAGSLSALPEWRGQEGPRFRITLGPACITVGHTDLARAERTAERAQHRARTEAGELGTYWAENLGDRAPADPRAPITGWSRRSRARLFHATGELDYTPMIVLGTAPVMSTLTYAKNWLDVAPTGAAAKKHLEAFYMRFERAWGVPFVGLWKEEFQRRGAVHFHLWHPRPSGLAGAMRRLTAVRYRPAVGDGLPYEAWLAAVWADIVAHPDPEDRARHEKRGAFVSKVEEGHVNTPAKLAAYFAKHGAFMAKDYQNKVPKEWREPGAGPGRFWGYKGLKREVRTVDVAPADADRAARVLRRLSSRERYWDPTYRDAAGKVVGCWRWKKAVREVRVRRGDRPANRQTGEIKPRYRKAMRPPTRFASGSGFLCLDDAPTTLVNIARALDIWREYAPPTRRQVQARERAVRRRALELPATRRAVTDAHKH
ncbi:hypothetical protein ACFWD5_32150 [Streptomyces koyangensis]|uniref:hypothetical protein n=1 Tax=Streptomyces koyangensis TaxID=188770 RepID=UPI003667DD45